MSTLRELWDQAGLSKDVIQEIRRQHASKIATRQELADEYGVPKILVSRIVCGLTGKPFVAKVTESDVKDIRERYASGNVTQQDLADEYGVSQVHIGKIIRGVTWKHFGGPIEHTDHRRIMQAEDVLEVRNLYSAGNVTMRELAEEFQVSEGQISSIIRGLSWTDVDGPIKGVDY